MSRCTNKQIQLQGKKEFTHRNALGEFVKIRISRRPKSSKLTTRPTGKPNIRQLQQRCRMDYSRESRSVPEMVAGAAILAIGIWVKVDQISLLGFLEHIDDAPPELAQLTNVGYLLIAVGVFLALVGFLGCCGAMQENKCMLLSFFIIVLIIFIVEVAAAVVLFVFEPLAAKLLEDVGQKVSRSLRDKYGEDESFTAVWNNTMNELNCCGYYGYADFTASHFVNKTSSYPETCCLINLTRCDENSVQMLPIQGCFQAFVNLIEENAVLLAGVAIGIAALEIAAMTVSMILYKNVGK
ncbi:Tetraspanin-1 [Triplophysa tibetana]|uniref:Tetraspanin-1 n=1 Tax=Triplophysa tibetana TaxID=1572043 RepID=A0A5A9PH92_9TELE|nr:Tetraspanin-1 [Triplophysa tibetana]